MMAKMCREIKQQHSLNLARIFLESPFVTSVKDLKKALNKSLTSSKGPLKIKIINLGHRNN